MLIKRECVRLRNESVYVREYVCGCVCLYKCVCVFAYVSVCVCLCEWVSECVCDDEPC